MEWSFSKRCSNLLRPFPIKVSVPACWFLPSTLLMVSSSFPKRIPLFLMSTSLKSSCMITLPIWSMDMAIIRKYCPTRLIHVLKLALIHKRTKLYAPPNGKNTIESSTATKNNKKPRITLNFGFVPEFRLVEIQWVRLEDFLLCSCS